MRPITGLVNQVIFAQTTLIHEKIVNKLPLLVLYYMEVILTMGVNVTQNNMSKIFQSEYCDDLAEEVKDYIKQKTMENNTLVIIALYNQNGDKIN